MTILKKTVLALITLGISGITYAAAYPIPPDLPADGPVFYEPAVTKHGVYIGLGAGALYLNNDMTLSASDILNGTTIASTSGSTTDSNVGVNGDLQLGYSWSFPSRFFFGIEGFGNITSAKTSQTLYKTQTIGDITTTVSGTDDFAWKYVYGARALPGIQVTSNSVLYGIVGYARANADLSNASNNSNITDSGTGESQTLSATGDLKNTYGFNGYQLGVGTMIDLIPHLALRADFIYSGYSSQTLGSNSTAFDGGTASASLSASPYTLEGDLSLVYMFG